MDNSLATSSMKLLEVTNQSITSESHDNSSENMTLSVNEIQLFQFYAWGITGNIISILGILGNILSMVVLCHPRMRSPTSVFLIAQAIYDSVVLVNFVLCMSLPTIHSESLRRYMFIFPYIQPYAYPLALTAQTCSIYTTVGFTVERYIAVCHALKAAKFCSISRAQKSVFLIFICSAIYNIPRMFEYRTVTYTNEQTNISFTTFDQTNLSRNPLYQHIYFIYMNIFIMLLLPFTVLTVLNILLIRAVRKSSQTEGKQVSKKQKTENNLTVMLISVVGVFLVCQISSIVDNIFMATLEKEVLDTEPFIKLTCVSSVMVIINSAGNFYLYCVFGEKFRRIFCQIFGAVCLERANRHQILRYDTSLVQMAGRNSRKVPVRQTSSSSSCDVNTTKKSPHQLSRSSNGTGNCNAKYSPITEDTSCTDIWGVLQTYEVWYRHMRCGTDIWGVVQTYEVWYRHMRCGTDIWGVVQTYEVWYGHMRCGTESHRHCWCK